MKDHERGADSPSGEPWVPLSSPCFRGDEKRYVLDCLESGWVSTSGEYVERFEEAFAAYAGAKGAVACMNGTSALHLSLLLAGVQPGDEVIVPDVCFIAPINAVRYLGADPVFMDCDEYLNMDTSKLEAFLRDECSSTGGRTTNARTGKRIGAILPVHVFGAMCDMNALMPLAVRHGLPVIEDAAEAVGSRMRTGTYAGRHAGTIGTLGCYSFNGNKIITAGGGGLLVAGDEELLRRARYLAHQAKDDALRYVHHEVGYNYGMTALQAALGLAQLEHLGAFIEAKKRRRRGYEDAIARIAGLRLLEIPDSCDGNEWFYPLVVDEALYGLDRDALMVRMHRARIQVSPLWPLNSEQRPYRGCQTYRVVLARDYEKRVLSLPCSVGLSDADMARVLDVLREGAREDPA